MHQVMPDRESLKETRPCVDEPEDNAGWVEMSVRAASQPARCRASHRGEDRGCLPGLAGPSAYAFLDVGRDSGAEPQIERH
jgi:hypothetical protein